MSRLIGKKRKREIESIIKTKDCIKLMNKIADNAIDITITSPPYNKNKQKMERVSVVYNEFSDFIPWTEYKKNQIKVLNEIYRITKPGGHCFYIHKVQYVKKECIHPIIWINESDWTIRQEIVWDKVSTPNTNPYRFFQRHEVIYWLYKPMKNADFRLDPYLAR